MNWLLLKNSLLVAALATVLAVSCGFLAALCLACLPRTIRNFAFATAIAALALPPFLVTNCWLHFLGPTGVWRSWLPLDIMSLGGTVWILTLLLWPITLLFVWSAWRQLDVSQLESDPAVSGMWLIRALLFPAARGAIAQAAVLTFVLALNNFAVPAILQVKVFPAEMWIRFNTTFFQKPEGGFDFLSALQLTWPLVLAPLLLLMWFSRRAIRWPRVKRTMPPEIFRRQLGCRWFWFSVAVMGVVCFLSVGLPVAQLAFLKRTWTEMPGAFAAGKGAVWNSLSLAAVSALVCVALGLWTWRWRVGFLLWFLFFTPGVALGIALIKLFNRPVWASFYQSAGIIVLGFVVRYLAVSRMSGAHALQSTDRDLTDTATLDGASRWQLLRHVQWPQIAPQLAATCYVVFLLCLWDVESMILVVPPGGETLALRTFNLLHYGYNTQVNALCMILLALALAPLVFWSAARGIANLKSENSNHSLVVATAAVIGLLLSGCSPRLLPNETPIESKFFSRVQVVGTRGVGVGELNKPRSVAVDGRDNMYVVDMTGRVQKFSPTGDYLLSWQMEQTDKGRPKGLCRDREGNIVVNEPHYSRLNHFSPDGKLVAQWGTRGTNAAEIGFPRAVAVNSRNEIFVSEYAAVERVQRFALPVLSRESKGQSRSLSPDGGEGNPTGAVENARSPEFISAFGRAGTEPGEFNRAEGLCVDAQDRVYVADSCNHRVQVFTAEGKFLHAYGRAGAGVGELSYPYDICVDADGRQYVCEFGNSRIQVFDAHGQSLEIIGGPGAEPGRFANPWGVALDSRGNLYVADSQNHRVQKFIRKESIVRSQWSVAGISRTTDENKDNLSRASRITHHASLVPYHASR